MDAIRSCHLSGIHLLSMSTDCLIVEKLADDVFCFRRFPGLAFLTMDTAADDSFEDESHSEMGSIDTEGVSGYEVAF